jgi:hypothetical protein
MAAAAAAVDHDVTDLHPVFFHVDADVLPSCIHTVVHNMRANISLEEGEFFF